MPRRRSESKSLNVKESEKEAALDFLKNSAVGRRRCAVEGTLTAMALDQIPRFRRLILSAEFDLRDIAVAENDCRVESQSQGQSQGYTKVSLKNDRLKFLVFYNRKELSESEALLFSNSLGQIICSTYAALGIDMRTFPVGKIAVEPIGSDPSTKGKA